MRVTSIVIRSTLACVLFVCSSVAHAGSGTPLLDYALKQKFEPLARDLYYQHRVQETRRTLQRNPAPAENCWQTLGAVRFASLYEDLGEALGGMADYEGAVEAYRHALDCAPRADYLRGPLAADLMYLEQYPAARTIAERAADVEDSQSSANTVLAQLDYIDGHWEDAITRLRLEATQVEDDDIAAYWQCLLWLAQRRSGITQPELVSRGAPQNWPKPILESFTREVTEADLIRAIDQEEKPARRREMLTEALFYVGQHRLTAGDAESARLYLAATVNLKVHYFIEHHLARAELAKLRSGTAPDG